MSQLQKVNFFFFLILVSALLNASLIPLNEEMNLEPYICGNSVFLFSRDGSIFEFSLKENFLVKKFDNLLDSEFLPMCLERALLFVDKESSLVIFEDGRIRKIGNVSGKKVIVFNKKIFFVGENFIEENGGEKFEMPFKIKNIKNEGDENLFVFGENKFAIMKKNGDISYFDSPSKGINNGILFNKVIVLSDDRTLYFLNSKGRLKKRYSLMTEIVSLERSEDVIVLASKDHFLRVFDLKGYILFQKRLMGVPFPLKVMDKKIFVTVRNGKSLSVIEVDKGREIFSYEEKEGEIVSSPVVCENLVLFYVLSEDNRFYLKVQNLK